MNTFITDNEQRTRFVLKTNVFGAGDEHFWRWRRTRSALETNTFIVGDEDV